MGEGRGGRGEEGGFSCLKHSDMQSLFTNCALLIALGTTATSAFSAPAPLSSFRLGVSAGEKRGTLPLRAHVARSSGTARIAMGWADPDWKWGYGNGKAHNAAYDLRRGLSSESSRSKWMETLLSDEKLGWDDVKLCLALKWQRAAREGRDGGRGGFGDVMEMMRKCKYEGSDANDDRLVQDMSSRLAMLPGAESSVASGLPGREGQRRTVAARVLDRMDFVRIGL
mmetsp:Transcript_28986/g.69162  ORF Transcript_28986/g.69162 Transcript_28986/m.69162 type:complete len:226 (+) Transcript_28986:3-680(+)